MAEESETTEDDAPDEGEAVKFLFAVLDQDIVEGEGNSDTLRVNAGIKLLDYYVRIRQTASIDHKLAALTMENSVRATLRRIAMDENVEFSERVRAAGASL